MQTLLSRVLLSASAVSLVVGAVHVLPAAAAPSGTGGKITICHRTHSTTNPYRRISVSISAANGSSDRDHTHHVGAPFDATVTYPSNAKTWGDVIPSNLNWTVAGQALYNGGRCGGLTAQEFYNVEIEAGQAPADVLADLQEQDADEDRTVVLTGLTYTGNDPALVPTPTPTPSPTATVDPTPTPTATVEPTPTPTATVDPTPTPTATVDPTPTPTPTVDPTPTPTATVDPTPTPTATVDPTPTPTATVDPTPTATASTAPVVVAPPTTVPSTVPTSLPPVVPPPLAPAVTPTDSLDALAFLDLDGDGTRGVADPGVPGVPVLLDGEPVGSTDDDGALRTTASRGAHRLVATTPSSLAVVSSSDGRAAADVRVPVSATSAWWGLRGSSALHLRGLPSTVSWVWAGLDGRFGTSDDVRRTTRTAAGALDLSGLPAGSYRVAGVSAELVAGQALTTLGGASSSLPTTGASVVEEGAFAVALLVGGTALVLVGRRRRTAG